MSEQDLGRLPDGTGLSQAEPEVSALRASIPSAGEWVLFRSSTCEKVAVEVRQVAKVTPKLVRFAGERWPRQCHILDVVGSVADEATALRLRDAIAGVAGEFNRRRHAADEERSRRVTEALAAAKLQVARIIASGIEARSDATPQSGAAVGESPAPQGETPNE